MLKEEKTLKQSKALKKMLKQIEKKNYENQRPFRILLTLYGNSVIIMRLFMLNQPVLRNSYCYGNIAYAVVYIQSNVTFMRNLTNIRHSLF